MQYWLVRCPVITVPTEENAAHHAKVLDIPDAGKSGKNIGYSEAVEDGTRKDGTAMVRCVAFGEDLSGLENDPEITIIGRGVKS